MRISEEGPAARMTVAAPARQNALDAAAVGARRDGLSGIASGAGAEVPGSPRHERAPAIDHATRLREEGQ